MNSLVIGAGEVGTAIFGTIYDSEIIDKDDNAYGQYDVIHICFPYNEDFEYSVKEYRLAYNAKYTIIHSTVPVGTCERLGAYHSPIRGVHPTLKQSINVFTTYLAPDSKVLKEYLEQYGFNIELVKSSRDTEAGKLFSTLQLGLQVMVEKEIHKYCQKHGLDFGTVYEEFNRSYNEGYSKLGLNKFKRPILDHQPGKIGGHCVIPNTELLDMWLADLLNDRNGIYKLDHYDKVEESE